MNVCAKGCLAAAALAFFAYMGFEEIVKLAEETKEPEKNMEWLRHVLAGDKGLPV